MPWLLLLYSFSLRKPVAAVLQLLFYVMFFFSLEFVQLLRPLCGSREEIALSAELVSELKNEL